MALIGSFFLLKDHFLNGQKLIAVCQMWLKSAKCPLNILVGTRRCKKGENPHLTYMENKTEYQLAGTNTELEW